MILREENRILCVFKKKGCGGGYLERREIR
jgi:hypothetical protein